uniref:Ig-like domain-containing protein n=1 Tax=Cyprinodon variegatus TaxID=28743 RepID=A0A3Q2CID1_CYPVA
MEGRNVTLATPMEKLEMKHTVNWTKEEDAKKIQIALWKNGLITTEESFKHVLQVDQQTGSLTFIRITRDLRGIYRVKIKQGEEVHSEIVFKITVYEPVCFPNIMKKEFNITNPPEEKICYVTCSVRNGPDVNLTWFNGLNQIISINNTVDLSMNLSLPLGIQPEKKGNYTCQAQNPVTSERKMLSLAHSLIFLSFIVNSTSPAPTTGPTYQEKNLIKFLYHSFIDATKVWWPVITLIPVLVIFL